MSGVEFAAEPASPAPPQSPPEPTPESRVQPTRLQRLGGRSLTSRLVIMVVSLVTVLVLAIGATTFLALRYFLYHRLDQQVTQVTRANANAVKSLVNFGHAQQGTLHPSGKVWVAIFAPDGSPSDQVTVNPGNGFELMHLAVPTALELIHNPDTPNTVTTSVGEVIRVSMHRISSPGGPLYVAAGLSVADLNRTSHRLFVAELIIGLSAIGLALVLTYAGVRVSLRGLRRVTTTVQEVAAELGPSGVALQRRVPVTEHGTEVAQLTDSMNTLLQTTETQFAARVESEERMRQFLADASHELRTPLTSIRGYAELARMQRAAGHQDEDNLDRIEAEGTRMSRLVEDLLILARGGSGAEPARDVVDVGGLVGEAVSGARAAFPDRVIDQDAMVPMQVVGDTDQLVRVVRNLVTNAIVHTQPGPHVRVRAFRWDEPAPGVAIQVIDGGPGLPPEDAAHVFERFWRADKARTRARGGSGLGLSIVASIIAAHGGTVRFDSSVAAGSTVTVWLPAAAEQL